MVVFFVIIILAYFAGAIQPYFYKLFVDAIPGNDFNLLLLILLLYIGIRFTGSILEAVGRTVGDIVMIDAVPNANSDIFKHLQNLDFAFHASKSSGVLINRIKRGDHVFWSLHDVLNFKVVNFLINTSVMLYFFRQLDLRIVLLAFVSMVLSLVAARYLIPINVKARKDFNKVADKLTGIIVDNMINYDTVKMFSQEDWELARLKKVLKTWKKKLWKYSLSFRYLGIGVNTIVNISLFLILYLVLSSKGQFDLEPGNFVLVIGFLQRFNGVTSDLIWNLRNLTKNFEDMRKYFEILDEKIQVKDPKDPVEVGKISGEIEFKNVHFSYGEGKKDALRGINLPIRQSQSIALVGRSGAGKTTVIRLLMRFYDVNKGKITIDGIDVRDFKKSDLRSFMGIVPQEPILFNNTIGYNIGYGKEDATKKEIKAAAKMANINKFIESLPKKYKTQVGERGIKLSGGQKQRLAIARMILSDPEIIIFDEATSQLDSESERLIKDAFWKVVEDKTTIIIAHRLSTAMRADKIVVMEKGKVIESGSHKALLEDKDSLYGYFWDLQINID